MSYAVTTQKARKTYACAGHDIGHPINAGEVYVRVRWMPEPGFGFARHDVMFSPECYDKDLIEADYFH